MFAARRWSSLAVVVCSSVVLIACGGGNGGGMVSAKPPIFTSAPVTSAAQGVAYSYQLAATDPSGGTVSFALTTGPTGASLSGSTVTWTPTAAQSRASNNFTVTATTSENATATQSWTVSPTGVVTVNWINTYWEPGGPVQVPAVSSASLAVSAVVPQPDGSITVLKGATASAGVFSIAGVPAGNYWLAFGGANLLPDSTSAYWTNTSTFDAGHDIAGSPATVLNSISTTTFDLKFSGLDSVAVPTSIVFQPENNSPGLPLINFPNTPSPTIQLNVTSNIDWSQVSTLFLGQYEPSTLAPLNNAVLGPSAWLTDLSFTDGGVNPITQAFQSAPASLDLSIQGSQWASLLSGAGPATPSSYVGAFSLVVEPGVSGRNASTAIGGSNVVLASTTAQTGILFGVDPFAPSCDLPGFILLFQASTPAILTDQDLGTLQYSDPLSSTWTRAENLCEEAVVPIAIPNSTSTANFALVDTEAVAPSSAALAPTVGTVQSPTINGASLFTAATLTTTTPMLSWSAPATGSPFAYRVAVYVLASATSTPAYLAAGVFYTSQTAVTLPPLAAGNTYVFSISALADGTANVQTAPFRSSLPTGSASVVSAPITISSGSASPQIHGDARIVKRLSQPRPAPVADSPVVMRRTNRR